MPFRLRIDPVAQRQIDQFAEYLRDYSEDFAIEQIDRLDRILRLNLREAPLAAHVDIFSAQWRAVSFRQVRQGERDEAGREH